MEIKQKSNNQYLLYKIIIIIIIINISSCQNYINRIDNSIDIILIKLLDDSFNEMVRIYIFLFYLSLFIWSNIFLKKISDLILGQRIV